jgi:hypothetical protein
MSIEENRKRYEGSVTQALMQVPGHMVCERCYCCDAAPEEVCCWSCQGCCGEDYEDEWDDGWCDVCQGEGVVYVRSCIGSCDENGNHVKKVIS